MPTTYALSIGLFIRQLTNLLHCLTKAEAYSTQTSGAASVSELVESKLIDDMQGFIFQIKVAYDTTKWVCTEVVGMEHFEFLGKMETMDDCKARIEKTIETLKTVRPEDIKGKGDMEVVLRLPDENKKFTADGFILNFCIPNFFFHYTTAYNILRMKGVPLGKSDYLDMETVNG